MQLLFSEFRRPPEAGSRPGPVLTPPWAGLASAPPVDPPAWAAVRVRLDARWRELVGPFPPAGPLQPRVVRREELADHTRLLVHYRTDRAGAPDSEPDAYLLLPHGFTGRRPGMVVLHQTTNEHIAQAAGLSGRETMHLALHLVRRGYVCLAPRNFLWSREGVPLQQITSDLLGRRWREGNAGEFQWRTGMARMTWDAMRAADYLISRPEVDPDRIGCIGHSLGGKEALYLPAFDPRIRATVSCEGGIGLKFSNWEADWYLGKQIRGENFNSDHHELLALIAPRAFLLIGGESADGSPSWPYIEQCLPVWRAHSAEQRLGLMRHRFGHDFPPPGPEREQVWKWLDHWMGKDDR